MIATPKQTVKIKSNAMAKIQQPTELTNALPVSSEMLKHLDKDGVEYETIKGNEAMSDFMWIRIIPTTKSLLGLFHAGVHFGVNKTKAA